MKIVVRKDEFPMALKAESPVYYRDVRLGKLEDYADQKMPWAGGQSFVDYWNSEGRKHIQLGDTFTRERELREEVYYIEIDTLNDIRNILGNSMNCRVDIRNTNYIGFDLELRRF